MAIEIDFGEVFSKLVPDQIKKRLSPPASEPNFLAIFHGHERLFDYYGICPDALKESSSNGNGKIIKLQTRDGDLCIDLSTRTIIPPPKTSWSS